MYSKKYIIEKIEEFNHHNPIYDGVEGRIAYPAYFNIGERGWFLWVEDEWFKEFAHRIHTSIVKDVEYVNDLIIVETQNTRFVFKLINTESNFFEEYFKNNPYGMSFYCPSCGKYLGFDDKAVKKISCCPKCGHLFKRNLDES